MVYPIYPQEAYFNESLIWGKVKIEKHCKAEIVFGVQSKNCSGNGICQMFPRGTLQIERKYCHFGEVNIASDQRGNLLLDFNRKSMRRATLIKYFEKDHFYLEEDFWFPEFLQLALPNSPKKINRGYYLSSSFGDSQLIFLPKQMTSAD